jgi:hypothetical protein
MEIGDSTLSQQFWENVREREDGCWEWTGKVGDTGYGTLGGRLVHRIAAAAVAPIPDERVVDHTCHDPDRCPGGDTCPHRRCCNPAHLEVVTHQENVRRGWASRPKYPDRTGVPEIEQALTTWRILNERRDAMVREAHAAGFTINRIHVMSGLARPTIYRILGKS